MDLYHFFKSDEELMSILRIIAELGLADCWLAAGTLRNYVWNLLSGRPPLESASDLDVVFYDPAISYEQTLEVQKHLQESYPNYQWEVKNQVDMHIHSPNTAPYQSSRDAISKYPERCTAIAVRLDEGGKLELFLPYGADDILNFTVQPTPHFLADDARMSVYHKRMLKKNWQTKWSNLQFR